MVSSTVIAKGIEQRLLVALLSCHRGGAVLVRLARGKRLLFEVAVGSWARLELERAIVAVLREVRAKTYMPLKIQAVVDSDRDLSCVTSELEKAGITFG